MAADVVIQAVYTFLRIFHRLRSKAFESVTYRPSQGKHMDC